MSIKKYIQKIKQLPFTEKLMPLLKNKFVVTGLAFIVWIGFVDENNLVERIGLHSDLNEIEESKQYYKKKIAQDRYEMEELDNNENLERLAREKHMMKQKNEDIYLLITKDD